MIADLRGEYGDTIRQTVELRNLEREANAKRELYERLLEEFNSSSQLLTFDATTARVIGWAVPPDRKSAPQSRKIVLLAMFAAGVLGISVIFLREALDNGFRSYDQISRDLGLPYLGVLPVFRTDRSGPLWHRLLGRSRRTPGRRWIGLSRPARLFAASTWPTSVSAETMRSIHVQLMMQKQNSEAENRCQVVAVTSTTRGEGKTTTAVNLAGVLAQQNARVAVIDLDLVSRQMSKLLSPVSGAANDLSAFLEDPQASLARATALAEFPNLTVIGNFGKPPVQNVALHDQERLEALLNLLRRYFDFVILDLSPVQGVADTRLLAKMSDHLIYVIRWGVTPRSQVASVFAQQLVSKENILGVLFTRARLGKYRWFNRNDVMDYRR